MAIRRRLLCSTLLAGAGVMMAVLVEGCEIGPFHFENDPDLALTLLPDGSAGVGGGPSADCIPHDKATAVDDTCGVFVSSKGDDGKAGTKAEPVKTLKHAVEIANGRSLYACAEEFNESVTLPAGISLFGGLDCASAWVYIGDKTRSTLSGKADEVALTIVQDPLKPLMKAVVEDFNITAPDATAAGPSSIAAAVSGGVTMFERCELTAGNGADGADGEDAPATSAIAGMSGNSGKNACSAEVVTGAAQVETTCEAEQSIGGKGGVGLDTGGGPGAAGVPDLGVGKAGAGDSGAASWSCAASGGNGTAGAPGGSGGVGAGASATNLGVLLDADVKQLTGFRSTDGDNGTPGKIGQGGGGGGGVKGGATPCNGKPGAGGASGGSGGAGGCGGAAGKGGKGGGASIALVSLQADLTLTNVTLKAGNGGKGGKGGTPQAGGPGGKGGDGGSNLSIAGLKTGCKGGDGGAGGDGGPGGGGQGGHSVGLAYLGTPPAVGDKDIQLGIAGVGGLDGSNSADNTGAEGLVQKTLDIK